MPGGKTINVKELERLAKERAVRDGTAATERAHWAAVFKKAMELYGLDPIAWGFWYRLKKMDSARASRTFRALLSYNEMSPVDVQGDLEEFLKNAGPDESDEEVADSMEADADERDAPDTSALIVFGKALHDAVDEASVNRGFERFVADHPGSADVAAHLAKTRIREIATAHGGGADLRPDHLRNAHIQQVDQAASEAKVYSRRSNAERGAKRALGDNFQIVEVNGGFTYAPRPN